MLAVVSMALVSCGEGGNKGVMTPQTTTISGPLGSEFEVVDQPAKLQGDTWYVQLVSLKDNHDSDKRVRFGEMAAYGQVQVGFGIETFDKEGNIIAKREATGFDAPTEDVHDLMYLKKGETGFIRWKCDDSEKDLKDMTFKITSAKKNLF